MDFLPLAEAFLAWIWLGGYLFTHFVVSPALASLEVAPAERVRLRSVIGRRYGRLAAPFLLAWIALAMGHGAVDGFDAGIVVRLALVVALAVVAALHGMVLGGRLQALAEREANGGGTEVVRAREAAQRRSARVTPVSLLLSLVLAGWAAYAAGAAG